jgi:hypothetical protein
MKRKVRDLMSNLQDYVDGRLAIEYSIDSYANEFEFLRDCLKQLETMELRNEKEKDG